MSNIPTIENLTCKIYLWLSMEDIYLIIISELYFIIYGIYLWLFRLVKDHSWNIGIYSYIYIYIYVYDIMVIFHWRYPCHQRPPRWRATRFFATATAGSAMPESPVVWSSTNGDSGGLIINHGMKPGDEASGWQFAVWNEWKTRWTER